MSQEGKDSGCEAAFQVGLGCSRGKGGVVGGGDVRKECRNLLDEVMLCHVCHSASSHGCRPGFPHVLLLEVPEQHEALPPARPAVVPANLDRDSPMPCQRAEITGVPPAPQSRPATHRTRDDDRLPHLPQTPTILMVQPTNIAQSHLNDKAQDAPRSPQNFRYPERTVRDT